MIAAKAGTDGFSQQSGLRYTRGGQFQILKDARDPAKGDEPVQPEVVYTVATTDFMAYVAGGYKELFAAARNVRKTELDVHAALVAALAAGPVTARLDGRWHPLP